MLQTCSPLLIETYLTPAIQCASKFGYQLKSHLKYVIDSANTPVTATDLKLMFRYVFETCFH